MWLRSGSRRRVGGFTLVEVLVAIFGLAIVLVAAGQLVFATRRSAQRQQFQVDARQTARTAEDYANYLLRGATDFNVMMNNAGAIVVWVYRGTGGGGSSAHSTPITCPGSAGCQQATYDNVTSAAVADLGTDVITFGRPSNPQFITPTKWPGFQHASNVNWTVPPGMCPTTNANALAAFCSTIGMPASCDGMSGQLLLVDADGNWAYYQVTGVVGCEGNDCCANGIHVTSNPGQSDALNPPGGQPDLNSPRLVAGASFASLRVCRGWLEQKDGIFDATSDAGTGAHACTSAGWNTDPWTPLIPQVEDFQIAYLFRNGELWNDVPGHEITACNGTTSPPPNVPCAVGTCVTPPCTVNTYDISNVIGFRVTTTSVASLPMSLDSPRWTRPAGENRAAGTTKDNFYRYQASSFAMIRNRTGGS